MDPCALAAEPLHFACTFFALQNVGNFITDRPSSRVLAPPGGSSQIIFGQAAAPRPAPPPVMPAPYANSYEPSPVKAGGFGE